MTIKKHALRARILRATTALTVFGLLLQHSPRAIAQPAPPPGSAPSAGDPPSRVGRLASVTGTVSYHASSENQWTAATVNYPVTSGDAFWTEPQSGAEIEVSAIHAVLAPTTDFTVDTLDERNFSITEALGETYLRVRDLPVGSQISVATPRALVTITMAGRYEIASGDVDHPTTITVVEGAAHIGGGTLSLNAGPHQTATITGSENFEGLIGVEREDAFLQAQLARERSAAPVTVRYRPPPAVQQMTGVEALLDTGDWSPNPQYGEVWYPPVQRDWVPYRHGHWGWVSPWGWTWIDDASWGFAPSHYGRWVQVNDRWGWTPLVPSAPVNEEPVYAPAVVSFVDLAAAGAVGAAVGFAAGAAVGWIPLGPRELYYPPYRASESYIRRVNVTDVTNIQNFNTTNIDNRGRQTFVNRGAATLVPAVAMTRSEPIAQRVQPLGGRDFDTVQPLREVPVRPTLATLGVTPSVARQLDLRASPSEAAVARPMAPGPTLRQAPPMGAGSAAGPSNTGLPNAEQARPGVSTAVGLGAGAAIVGGAAVLGGAALLGRRTPNGLPPLTGAGPGGGPQQAGARPEIRPAGRPVLPGQPQTLGGGGQNASPVAGQARQNPPGFGAQPGARPSQAVAQPGFPTSLSQVPAAPRTPLVAAPQAPNRPAVPEFSRQALPSPNPAAPSPPAPGPARVEPPRGANASTPRTEPPHAPPARHEMARPEPQRAAIAPPARVEPPRVEPPRVEAPRVEAPRVEPPRAITPPPRVETPHVAVAPPAHVEAPRIAAPPPLRIEPQRSAPPPPRPVPAAAPAPRPAPPAAHQPGRPEHP